MCSQEEAHPSVVPECRPCELTQGGLWSTHGPCWCRTFLGCVLMLTVPLCVVLWPDASAMPLDSLRTHALPTHGVPVPRRQRHPCVQPLMSPQGHSAPFEHRWQCHGSHSSAFAVFFLAHACRVLVGFTQPIHCWTVLSSSCPSRPFSQ